MIDGEYTCGDVRCRENPGLASLHTLFVLEHNSIVDMLREKYHTLSGNELYERARRIVGAEIQNVAYGQCSSENDQTNTVACKIWHNNALYDIKSWWILVEHE